MDQSAAPWRALEEDGPGGGGEPSVDRDARITARSGGGRTGWLVAAFAIAAIAIGAAIWLVVTNGRGALVVEGGGPAPDRSDGIHAMADRSPKHADADLVVDVQGAVVRPGVVHLPAGSRVGDAIAAAGGYGPRVAADRVGQALNLAALVKDGDQVVVPSRDDQAAVASGRSTGTSGSGGSAGPVDLNRATVAELDALPGIGPVTAAKIVAARDEQAFTSVDDLRTRKILGAATFDKVKDLVVVR